MGFKEDIQKAMEHIKKHEREFEPPHCFFCGGAVPSMHLDWCPYLKALNKYLKDYDGSQ